MCEKIFKWLSALVVWVLLCKLSNWSTFGVNTFSNTKYVYTVKPLLTTTPKIRPTRY